MLIDVRPAEEYAAGHIDGARSIPIDELEERLAELPADREVVAYCRGPFCAYAHEAVRRSGAPAGPHGGSRTAGPNGDSRSEPASKTPGDTSGRTNPTTKQPKHT